MLTKLRSLFLGKPIPTHEMPHQTISVPVGLAVFASDVLSSVAYATEEILIVLAAAGAAYFNLSIPISIAISILLLILMISYRQTIFAYPSGGGAYIVARDNLGEGPAQTAGAALLIDYILTVSVSMASGVAQIVSAFPDLSRWRVEIAVGAILFMMLINLRGVRESGMFFAVPTYFFIITMFGMLAVGFYKFFTGGLHEVTGIQPIMGVAQPLTLFLLLKAFSSGAVAVTGTEAISNGITAFREPKSRNAAKTLTLMSFLIGAMFIGTTLLAHYIHAVPMENETVISQIARTVYGTGLLHLITLAATTMILILAANTAFADFPRLGALHAGDGFLPKQLTLRGSRLVFSVGIISLAAISSLLVVVFDANVTRLIPLYAIGVFLSFVMSQTGMVMHWQKIGRLREDEVIETSGSVLRHDPRWRGKQIINAFGAVITAMVMIIFAVTKFLQGAWIVVILIPTLVYIFFRIHHHYKSTAEQLDLTKPVPLLPRKKTVVIPVGSINQGTMKAIQLVRLLEPTNIKAVYIDLDSNPKETEKLKNRWKELVPDITLDVVESPYRELIEPLINYIEQVDNLWPDDTVVVTMPEIVPTKFWNFWLHGHTARHIRNELERRENVMILDVPYRILDRADKYSVKKILSSLKSLAGRIKFK